MKYPYEKIWLVLLIPILVLLTGTAIYLQLDLRVSDSLYQKEVARQAGEPEIVLVMIDEKTCTELDTPFGWDRQYYAEVLRFLNSSEDCHPSVIGIDAVFARSREGEEDFLQAVTDPLYDNVVIGSRLLMNDAENQSEQSEELTLFQDMDHAHYGITDLIDHSDRGGRLYTLGLDQVVRHVCTRVQGHPSFAGSILALLYEKGLTQVDPDTVPEEFYLKFTVPPQSESGKCKTWSDVSCSFYDLYQCALGESDKYTPEDFDGKIVLLGIYYTGLGDEYFTAIDHTRRMFGVEIQANTLRAMLREDYKTEAPDGIQRVVLAAVLFLTALLFACAPLWFCVLSWAILTPGSLWLDLLVYRKLDLLLHPLWIPVGVSVLLLTAVVLHYLRAAREKKRIRNQFGRYVAPQVLEEILKQGDEELALKGKKAEIAVLFVDIRGFTAFSEGRDPETVVAILNEYLTLITSCIVEYGGTLDKFIGDCGMAFWNAPLPQSDYVMLAARAANSMLRKSSSVSLRIREMYGTELSFGIGIHCGEAVIGNIGSPMRMDYTVIGDTVNTASRIEGKAQGGSVYITEAVLKQLGDRVRVTPLPPMDIKGKTNRPVVYMLDEIKGDEKV